MNKNNIIFSLLLFVLVLLPKSEEVNAPIPVITNAKLLEQSYYYASYGDLISCKINYNKSFLDDIYQKYNNNNSNETISGYNNSSNSSGNSIKLYLKFTNKNTKEYKLFETYKSLLILNNNNNNNKLFDNYVIETKLDINTTQLNIDKLYSCCLIASSSSASFHSKFVYDDDNDSIKFQSCSYLKLEEHEETIANEDDDDDDINDKSKIKENKTNNKNGKLPLAPSLHSSSSTTIDLDYSNNIILLSTPVLMILFIIVLISIITCIKLLNIRNRNKHVFNDYDTTNAISYYTNEAFNPMEVDESASSSSLPITNDLSTHTIYFIKPSINRLNRDNSSNRDMPPTYDEVIRDSRDSGY